MPKSATIASESIRVTNLLMAYDPSVHLHIQKLLLVLLTQTLPKQQEISSASDADGSRHEYGQRASGGCHPYYVAEDCFLT